MKLGSLFDGSGGFPLAGVINNITPVWASEIESYPLKVTAARFPNMKQLGDITKINGADIEPVDIITFGSPCQDLSIAGGRDGIHKGERSNLFFEAIRIIKEMREKTNDKYPRFALWENVPGAFSSNKGEDFRAVLEALASVCGNDLHVPRPEKNKWLKRGGVAANGWSLAWRVYDAQYWGVPQRRKRIYLVADFASERALEILFECESLRGDSQESGRAGERVADDAERSTGRSSSVKCLNPWDVQSKHIVVPDGVSETMCAAEKRWAAIPPNICYAFKERAGKPGGQGDSPNPIDQHQQDSRFKLLNKDDPMPTLPAQMGTGGNNTPMCLHVGNGQLHSMTMTEQTNALDCMHDQQAIITNSPSPRKYIIRRLTPLECCRLQGFPNIAKVDVDIMTRDEMIMFCLAEALIKVDVDTGKIYGCRGPGGVLLGEYHELKGTMVNGYIVHTLNLNGVKKQVRANRIVWTAAHGAIPDGMVVNHINNDKTDNRANNLQLLTPSQNSTKARADGLYKVGDESPQAKTTEAERQLIAYLYWHTDTTHQRLATQFGLSKSRIGQIVKDYQGWDGDIEGSDTARYKMWGNGIALPCAVDVLGRIAKELTKGDISYENDRA